MKNNPIEVMYSEHDFIMKAEDVINNCKKSWENDSSGYSLLVGQLVIFFKEYADGYHHHKEELVLFPAIQNHPDFVLEGMIDEFIEHHESFRDYTKEILEALADKEYSKSHDLLKAYCNDLLDHIAAENDELFVLAENLLSVDELETIYFKFKDIDLEQGEARKIELEEMIDSMTGE